MAVSSGTAGLSDTRGDKNVVAQIAKLSWDKIKSAENMAGTEKKYARNKLKVGQEGGLTQEEFSQRFGRGSFFRKALGSQFGGDKIARNRGRVESFFDKDVPGGRDATKSRQGRYREGFDYSLPEVEAKDSMVGRKPKTEKNKEEGEKKSSRSSRAAINEAMASALAGIEIQLTRLSEKFTNTTSVPEGLIEIINKQSQVVTSGFDGLSKALYTLLGSIQKQTATMVRLDQEQKNLDAKNIDRQQALDEEALLEGQDGGAGNASVKEFGKIGKGGSEGGFFGKMFGASALAQKIARRGAGRAAKRAAISMGGKGAAKFITKGAGKAFAKAGLKSGLKKIPLLGLGVGALFAAQRAMKGDYIGAGLELTSGAASMVPGAGTAASLGVDGIIAARDGGAIPFAKGGMVTKPTLGVVGEGKDPELITPWNKKTFDMMNKARLDAIQRNKNKFADVQAEGLKEYYENRGGWQKFGETLITLLKGAGGIFDPDYTPPGGPPGNGELDAASVEADTAKEKAFIATVREVEGTAGEDGYTKVYGGNVIPQLTQMTLGEVKESMLSGNLPQRFGGGSMGYKSGSRATGAPQLMPDTLQGLLDRGTFKSTDIFNAKTQNSILLHLARAGGVDIENITESQLIKANNIWSGLGPRYNQTSRTIKQSMQIYQQNLAEANAQTPPPPPNKPTGPDWLKGIGDNFGVPLGGSFSFGPENKYKAVRERDGWKLYDTTKAYLPGNQDISTTNNANIGLKDMFIEKGRSLTQPAGDDRQATALSSKSQEVALAKTTSGANVQVSLINNGGGSSAAVPKHDSSRVGISRRDLSPIFTEVAVG
jgi:hypothetical protein